MAADAGVDLDTFFDKADYFWTFSDDPDEDYPSPALSTSAMRTPTTLGSASGPFAVHPYVKAGLHTARVLVFYEGTIWGGSIDINVSEIEWSARSVAYCGSGATGDGSTEEAAIVSAIDATFTPAQIEDALAAVEAGTHDALILQRGEDYTFSTASQPLVSDAIYRSIGTGERATLRPLFDDGTAATAGNIHGWEDPYYDSSAETDGSTVTFTATSALNAGSHYIAYVDGTRYTVASFDAATGDFTLDAAPPAGTRLLLLRCEATQTIEPGKAYLANTGGGLFLASAGVGEVTENILLHGIRLKSLHDDTSPSVFDPDDLSTYGHEVQFSGVILSSQPGDGVNDGAVRDVTLFDCEIDGNVAGISANGFSNNARRLFVVGCKLVNSKTYGIYRAAMPQSAAVGCFIAHSIDAVRDVGNSNENLAYVANETSAGPMRSARDMHDVYNRNYCESRVDWAGAYPSAQPIRPAASGIAGQSFSFTENTYIGGVVLALGPGAGGQPAPTFRLAFIARNWLQATAAATSSIIVSGFGGTSIGNVFDIAGNDSRGRPLGIFGGTNADTAAGSRVPDWRHPPQRRLAGQ